MHPMRQASIKADLVTAQVIPFAARARGVHHKRTFARDGHDDQPFRLTLPILLPVWPWGFVWGRVTVEW